MTINAAAVQLLTYLSPEERSIPDSVTYPGRNGAVALAMNLALQEMFGSGSPWVRYDERGALLYAPTAVTISVTNGSTSATISSGWADWMAGCAIVIDGSAFDNAIRNDSSSVVLKTPYDGTTGSKSATVYHTSINPASDVLEVLEPIKANMLPLTALASSTPVATKPSEEDYGFHRRTTIYPPPLRVGERTGQPLGFSVETWSKNATTEPRPRILIQPAPAEAGMLEYRAMLAPPVVVSDLTSTAALPVPFQFVQSVFFPIARFHLSASPFYRAIDGQAVVNAAYQQAKDLLVSLNPAPRAGTRWTNPY